MPITRLLLVLEVWDGKPSYRKSWAGNLLVWSDLTFGPLLQGQIRTAKPKSGYNSLIIGPRGLDGKPTYRKSWAGNDFVWLDLTLDPFFKVVQGYCICTISLNMF